MLKRLCILLLAAMMVWNVFAGLAAAGSIGNTGMNQAAENMAQEDAEGTDLDLTNLIGDPLLKRLTDMCAEPEIWDGQTLRVRGQYFALPSGEDVRRTLIVCDSCQCSEIGILLVAEEGAEDIWPENLQNVETAGTLEKYETSVGTASLRLRVFELIQR